MNPQQQELYTSLQADPQNWELRFALIETLSQAGALPDAVQVIAEAPVIPSEESHLRKILSVCRDAERLDVAEPFVSTFLTSFPSSAVGHYLYAKLLSKMNKDLAKAREHYDTAVSLNPELEDEVLATKLADLGQTQEQAVPSEPQIASLTPPPGLATSRQIPVAVVPPVEEEAAAPEENGDPYEGIEAETPDVAFGETAPGDQAVGNTTRYLVVGEGEKVKPMEKKAETPQKLSAVMIAILVHVGVLFLLALVVMNIPERRPPEIVARAPAILDEQVIQKEEIKKIVQRKPVQSAQTQMEVLTVAGASKVSMPDIQTDLTSFDPIGMGDSFGSSMSFDAGEDGGMVSFFGARSVSKRVVFAVDYSASMNSQDKHKLMRKELSKSLESLPGGIEYQCIFFAGPAWEHGQQVKSISGNKSFEVTAERGRDEWKWLRGFDKESNGGALYFPSWGLDPKDLPSPKYLQSSRRNIRQSIEIVQETKLVYGTDWRWPLYMAMNMEPDTIFFMTDGAFGAPNKDRLIDELIRYSKSKGRPKINTVCMMVLAAEKELTALAEGTRGEFTLVLEDQTVIRGKDLEEYKRKQKK